MVKEDQLVANGIVSLTQFYQTIRRSFKVNPLRVARFAIYSAINGEKFNDKSYNLTEDATSWSVRWPQLAAFFGLKGVPPTQDAPVEVEKWAKANAGTWEELAREFNLKPGGIENGVWDFMEGMLSFDMDRVYDNTARRTAGFNEKADSIPSFKQAFELFVQFKQIPPL